MWGFTYYVEMRISYSEDEGGLETEITSIDFGTWGVRGIW
jgi:hypothetical protein